MDIDEVSKVLRASTKGVYQRVEQDRRGPQGIIRDRMAELGHLPGRWQEGPRDGYWASSVIHCKHCSAWAAYGNAVFRVDKNGRQWRSMAVWGPALQLSCDWVLSIERLFVQLAEDFMAKHAPLRWVA